MSPVLNNYYIKFASHLSMSLRNPAPYLCLQRAHKTLPIEANRHQFERKTTVVSQHPPPSPPGRQEPLAC